MGQKIYFLPLSDKGREQLTEAEAHLRNAKLQWTEISCDEINSKSCIKQYIEKSIFIVSPLEGDTYNRLVENGARVYGAGAIISSLQLQVPLPRKQKDFSQGCLSSLALRGMNVCFTNIPKSDREKLQAQVTRMAGNICSTMTQEVNVLIVGEVCSKKYIVASELGIKTVTPDFITDIWNLSVDRIRPVVPDSDLYNELLKNNACPIFHGCTVSVTNIDSQSRAEISKLVVANGGCYNGTLDRNQVTHLVAGGPGGKKLKHAKTWGIEVVTLDWIDDSLARGFAQDHQQAKYQFNEESFAEQPSQIETTSRAIVNETEIDEKTDMFDLDKFAAKDHDIEEDAFNRVSAFISGFPARGKKKLKELIQKGGGMVFDSLTPSITHMIVARQSLENNEDLAFWRAMTSGRPIAIDLFWVINTIKNGERENPEGYKVLNMEGTVNEGDETLRIEARSFNGDIPKNSENGDLEQSTFGTLEVTESQAVQSTLHTSHVRSPRKSTFINHSTSRRDTRRQSSPIHNTRKSNIPLPIERETYEEPSSLVTVRILPGGEDHPMRKVFGVEDFWARKNCRLVANYDPNEKVDYAVSFLLVRGDLDGWEGSFESCFYFEGLENTEDIESVEERENTRVYWCCSPRLFSGAGFCTAKYQENEKKIVRQAVEAGGGAFSASMDRDVTHVIAPDWNGAKQVKAISSGLSCVTLGWILACLEESRSNSSLTWHSVPMDDYAPAGPKPKPALPKPVASSTKKRKPDRYGSVMVESPCVANANQRTPHIASRPDLTEMAKFVETPKNMRDPTLPSTTECKRILKQAVKDSNEERCKRDGIGIYSKSAIKEREKRALEPKTPKAQNVPIPKLVFDNLDKGIFDGYSLYIHESITSQRNKNLIEKVEGMGAVITYTFDGSQNITHCIISDEPVQEEALNKIIKLTDKYSICLVRFSWLLSALSSNKVPAVGKFQDVKQTKEPLLPILKNELTTDSVRKSTTPNGRRGRHKRTRSRLDDEEGGEQRYFSGSEDEDSANKIKRVDSPEDEIEELSSGDFNETRTVDLKSPDRLDRIANERHRVIFSLVSRATQAELKTMIEEINGSSVLTAASYDQKATMLIFEKDPIRNEKISAAIVSGIPCCHVSYVRNSYHQNDKKWLDPLDYPHEVNMSENIDAKAMRSKTESKDVVRAITGWYERLQINPEQKVFARWKVWLMYNGGRGCPSSSFSRILAAGGATIIGRSVMWADIEEHIEDLSHILAPKENDALINPENLALCLNKSVAVASGDVISKAIIKKLSNEQDGVFEATSFLPSYSAARKKKYGL